MKLSLVTRAFALSLIFFRKESVVGITSKVPDSDEHYHLFDVDDALSAEFVDFWSREGMANYPHFSYRSPHGVHVISLRSCDFSEVFVRLSRCEIVDKKWLGIGIKRGYFFLQSYDRPPEWARKQLSYMRIQRAVR